MFKVLTRTHSRFTDQGDTVNTRKSMLGVVKEKITDCSTARVIVVCNNGPSLSYTTYNVFFLCFRLFTTFYATRDRQ